MSNRRINMRKLVIAVMITFIFAGNSFGADIDIGEGYHVQDGFSSILITNSDGTAIQNAVDHIKDGGTVELSGDFKLKRNITINKNLTLRGTTNALLSYDKGALKTFCIITCEGSNDITLENLTITGGMKTKGAGINISGGSIKIISCDIHDNFSWLGGGAVCSFAETLILKSCDIHDNKSTALGGGLVIDSSKVTITDCSITKNTAAMTGGGLLARSSDITMENCKIKENISTFAGTGVKLMGTKLKAISCDISDNFIMSLDQGIPNPEANISYDDNSIYEEVEQEGK